MNDHRPARKRLGDFGEEYAAQLLLRQGYQIVVRGWRCAAGEIDITSIDGEELVFVEVRTRRGGRFGTPEESIMGTKAARLLRLGLHFLQEHPEHQHRIWRIDLVAIVLDAQGRLVRVSHHVNAVET